MNEGFMVAVVEIEGAELIGSALDIVSFESMGENHDACTMDNASVKL
ncbi:hypothetical protein P8452_52576 [Trifolium repens]|nr:hypothetical protein P8452_52576 [Trifolium repens]